MGVLVGIVAYSMIGAGAGAAGTSVLAMLASQTAPTRRPAAASIAWIMMILGIVVSAAVSGHYLQPFSAPRLATVASAVAGLAFVLALVAVWRLEREGVAAAPAPVAAAGPKPSFNQVIGEIWADRLARRFTIFVFVSMLAYSAQELILEPFAGLVFGMNPGQSTQLSSVQHGGVLLGMILVGALGARFGGRKAAWMQGWTIAGCVGSALAIAALGVASLVGRGWPLAPTVFVLGFANGVFAVSAIGSMMALAGAGKGGAREGARMGVWGAAQALAFAFGGFLGAGGVDLMRGLLGRPGPAFVGVFAVEAAVFLAAAVLAARLDKAPVPATGAGAGVGGAIEFGGAR
jgi:BCD family chlorophyll transporter-like MFS transporter